MVWLPTVDLEVVRDREDLLLRALPVENSSEPSAIWWLRR